MRSHKVLKQVGQSFVLKLLETLKTHMTDEKVMVDRLVDFLHHKVGSLDSSITQKRSNVTSASNILIKLQETAEDLNH